MLEKENEYDKELESGKYLFKYCRFDINALQIIINKTLYFCTPDKLNDPLDSCFDIEIINPQNFSDKTRDLICNSGFPINESVKSLSRDFSLLQGNIEKQKIFLKEYWHDMQNKFLGICSFSNKSMDQNIMWSHYTNEARGLCLVFDREKLIQSLLNEKQGNYRMYKGNVTYNSINPLEVEINNEGELCSTYGHLFSKTKHWANEDEYRIVIEKVNTDGFNPNIFDPFLKFDDSCLKFIVAGERIQKEHLNVLIRLELNKCFTATLLQHKFDR